MLLNEKLTKWRNEYIIKFEDSLASQISFLEYSDSLIDNIHEKSFEYAKAGLLRLVSFLKY